MAKQRQLLYWYDTAEDDFSNAFSFVPNKNILSYKEGVAKGFNSIPVHIQRKIDKGGRLTSKEWLLCASYGAIEEDAAKSKEERQPWLFDFKEEYELSEDEGGNDEDSEEKGFDEEVIEEDKQIDAGDDSKEVNIEDVQEEVQEQIDPNNQSKERQTTIATTAGQCAHGSNQNQEMEEQKDGNVIEVNAQLTNNIEPINNRPCNLKSVLAQCEVEIYGREQKGGFQKRLTKLEKDCFEKDCNSQTLHDRVSRLSNFLFGDN